MKLIAVTCPVGDSCSAFRSSAQAQFHSKLRVALGSLFDVPST
jgi:hypothetical protein